MAGAFDEFCVDIDLHMIWTDLRMSFSHKFAGVLIQHFVKEASLLQGTRL